MLTKSLLPLPDKFHGMEDLELKARKRYLDAAIESEIFDRFVLRSKIVSYIRDFFNKKGFLEVETPILQNQAGGAMAKTFNTFHNDYQIPMVLRIALELEHKMMMVSGFSRVYEIGKIFRNEGTDPTHAQEFTMIEWYAAFESLQTNMDWTKELILGIARDLCGKTNFTVYDKFGVGVEIDLGKKWEVKRFDELLLEKASINMQTATLLEIQDKAREYNMEEKEILTTGKGNLLDFIFKKAVRSGIIDPTFVTNYPSELKPLAQQNEDGTAQVYQLIVAGAELNNAYAELVDPRIQRILLEDQAKAKDAGDLEAMEVDERFLTAMEHGMPPMTGFGMGIDRLVAMFCDQKSIRDVIFFPIMKNEE
jgi:lysyl-tRNA synthetase, class II